MFLLTRIRVLEEEISGKKEESSDTRTAQLARDNASLSAKCVTPKMRTDKSGAVSWLSVEFIYAQPRLSRQGSPLYVATAGVRYVATDTLDQSGGGRNSSREQTKSSTFLGIKSDPLVKKMIHILTRDGRKIVG